MSFFFSLFLLVSNGCVGVGWFPHFTGGRIAWVCLVHRKVVEN